MKAFMELHQNQEQGEESPGSSKSEEDSDGAVIEEEEIREF